jgi:hypothetical protein
MDHLNLPIIPTPLARKRRRPKAPLYIEVDFERAIRHANLVFLSLTICRAAVLPTIRCEAILAAFFW